MSLFKAKLPIISNGSGTKDNVVIVSMSFTKGGISWGTGESVKKGYRVSVYPAMSRGLITEFEAFSGFGDTIYEVEGRQSKKKLNEAIRILKEEKAPIYEEWFKRNKNIEVKFNFN